MYMSLKEIQSEELELLIWFDGFCKNHDLRYSLDGGTLLGAVRHKGFIPWDDDVDLIMPRPDYERLIKLAATVPRPYEIRCSRLRNGHYPFVKVCNTKIRAQELSLVGLEDECLWLDVFPADGTLGGLDELAHRHKRINKLNKRAMLISRRGAGWKAAPKRFVQLFVGNNTSDITLYNEVDQLASVHVFDESEMTGNLVWTSSIKTIVIPPCEFDNTVDIAFCNHRMPAIGCWHQYLTALYGDYMTPPPAPERKAHGIKAWRISE